MCGAAARLHQSYHRHPFVSVVLKVCNNYLIFKGVNFIFLSACLMFLVVVFMYHWGYGVSCFHTWITLISFNLKWYFIMLSHQSWISAQIISESLFIWQFCNRLLIKKIRENGRKTKKNVRFSPNWVNKLRHQPDEPRKPPNDVWKEG